MTEILEWTKSNLPPWGIGTIILFAGMVKYGPKFLKDVISVGEEWNNKSEKVKNEYIAMLRNDKQKLEKTNTQLLEQIKNLTSRKA